MEYVPNILSRHGYLDTIAVWSPFRLSFNQLCALDATCNSLNWRNATPHFDRRCVQRLVMNRPTPRTFKLLVSWLGEDYMITHLAVADLIVESEDELEQVEWFLLNHLVRLWPGKDWPFRYHDTIYWSRRRAVRKNIVLYCDRECRVTGEQFCAHVEVRLQSKAAVEHRELHDLNALQGFDSVRFLRSTLSLRDVKPRLVFNEAVRTVERYRIQNEERFRPSAPSAPAEARRWLATWLLGNQCDTKDGHDAALPWWALEMVKRCPVDFKDSAMPRLDTGLILPDAAAE